MADPADTLPTRFFARPAIAVARDLLGTRIVSTVAGRYCAGRIVETEAYTGPEDDASHAAERIGRTSRNRSMFGAPGTAYVYRIYGVHWCLNFVTDRVDHPAAVLIRAVEPIEGVEVMRERRRSGIPDWQLGRGPGNLARALGIDGALDGHDLRSPPLQVVGGRRLPDSVVATGPRIGISRARELPFRFFVHSSRSVSGKRSGSPAR